MSNNTITNNTIETCSCGVKKVSARLTAADRFGALKARIGVGRMSYTVAPGLYAAGNPGPDSIVLVSANYKLSFDRLRSNLAGLDAWILVLDTKGINVWCAAGKGTFGTGELVRRIEAARLADVVSHRQLILPQLGAPGVSAHEVKSLSGFRVIYGPVRAEDLRAFLDAGMKADPEMRRVRFPLRDRLVLIPVEISLGLKYALPVLAFLFLVSGFGRSGFSIARMISHGCVSASLIAGAYLAGVALTPALLPWLPGRAFSLKGAFAGFIFALATVVYSLAGGKVFNNPVNIAAWLLMIPAVASFTGMNFTGSSTYTSLSGVKHEMKIALPIQKFCAAAGLILFIAGLFV